MLPIVTPQEMAAIDAAAPEPLEVLIERASWAVMNQALKMLNGARGCSSKSVLVIYGKGNNGKDGLCAGELLKARGFSVNYLEAADAQGLEIDWMAQTAQTTDTAQTTEIGVPDLIIDAAYGTGLTRPYSAPKLLPENTPLKDTLPKDILPQNAAFAKRLPQVLAVDIASGVDGLTGEISGNALPADRTITFGALKPGHLIYPGSEYAGQIHLDGIGLDVSGARAWLLTDQDIKQALPARSPDAHKWQSACWLIGGSKTMRGAASLMALGAYKTGAGYVRISSVADRDKAIEKIKSLSSADLRLEVSWEQNTQDPVEAVSTVLPAKDFARDILENSHRFGAVAFGPGLGTESLTSHKKELKTLLAKLEKPLLLDGDGLTALAELGPQACQKRKFPTILTPHEGEFERLNGSPVSKDRFESVRSLAEKYNAVVLLKGYVTLVASPEGKILVSNTGDARLASAGTGDILTGIISALLAQGVKPHLAAAMGAFIHGKAAKLGSEIGLMASELASFLPTAIKNIRHTEI